ncbi:hypothetical protein [Microvirga yunnanensis]|uniref:hypothetical protein n=1 Tax=Microvirga yunnanensis TaxID=2953740 RepID=UPI0021C94062|nr:hypothetical protein [Microvirga sp. HBU67655]
MATPPAPPPSPTLYQNRLAIQMIDMTPWQNLYGGYGRVLPKALAFALNGVAFAARDMARDEAKRVFDRPAPFSIRNAFMYKAARLSAGSIDEIESQVFIKDRQSAYYVFQIPEGQKDREPGNIGPGRTWLFMPVLRDAKDPSLVDAKTGGLKRNVLKGLIRRSGLAGQQEVSESQRRRDAGKRPVWFGEYKGVHGIWERPERTPKENPRQNGVRQVRNVSGPRLLVAAYQKQTYDNRPFDFFTIVARANDDLPIRFSEAVREELRKGGYIT